MKVFCNARLVERESLEEIFEPGFLFGWGTFETLRAYKRKVPFLDLHIKRLNRNLSVLGIEEVNLDFKGAIRALLNENNLDDAYLRITAYKKRESTGIIIYADKFGYYPQETYGKGFSVMVSPYKKDIKNPFLQIKSLSYLENRMSWLEAQKANKDEALVLNQRGFLVGGSRSNIFLIKEQEVFIPSLNKSGAFSGITKTIVIKILKNLRIKVKEKELRIKDLLSCDEAFLTSALLEVMPLVECEDKKIGNGEPREITLRVLSEYRKIINT